MFSAFKTLQLLWYSGVTCMRNYTIDPVLLQTLGRGVMDAMEPSLSLLTAGGKLEGTKEALMCYKVPFYALGYSPIINKAHLLRINVFFKQAYLFPFIRITYPFSFFTRKQINA